MDHGGFSVSPHHHLLLLELFRHLWEREPQGSGSSAFEWASITASYGEADTYVLGGGAGHLDPGFGEKGTWSQHEDDVNEGMDRVVQDRAERFGRREIVAESTDRVGAGWPTWWRVLHEKKCQVQISDQNFQKSSISLPFQRKKKIITKNVKDTYRPSAE